MKLKVYIVDAFTNEPFRGNPAGVCLLEKAIPESEMQSIASELNLSETAFILKNDSKENYFHIRYFTPLVEIGFCGHATLASSKILLDKFNHDTVSFITGKHLELNAVIDQPFIKMEFPLYEAKSHTATPQLMEAFGIDVAVSIRYAHELEMLIVEVANKQTLENIQPDYQKALDSPDKIKELVVTTSSKDGNYDFYSRCFCPWIGINEDPVTGASHAVLAQYWSEKLGKKEMTAYQLSKRGGFLNLRIVSDAILEVRSNAKVVFEGIINS